MDITKPINIVSKYEAFINIMAPATILQLLGEVALNGHSGIGAYSMSNQILSQRQDSINNPILYFFDPNLTLSSSKLERQVSLS